MRSFLAALLVGLVLAGPAWSQNTTPCPASTHVPVFYQIAPPVCAGQPLRLVARACGPCVDLLGWTMEPPGPIQIHAKMSLSDCILTVCRPESLVVPLGTFAAGHHVLVIEVRGTVIRPDGSVCSVVQRDAVEFDVPFDCPPPPLPYTDAIRVGPPPPCNTCPPPPICPNREIPFFIAGHFPDDCFRLRGIELLPSPVASPLPEPPIVRVTVAYNDCMGTPCTLAPIPWQATAMLPGLPPRGYHLMVQMAMVSWCDPTREPDTVYTTLAPFTVAERCTVPDAPECFLYGWRPGTANTGCNTFVGPGAPGRAVFQMNTGTVLAGLEGRFVLDPAALQITELRPVGLAEGMSLAWNPLPDGARFALFSTAGHTVASPCIPPAMCPPGLDPVLEVTVAPRPGVPIPPVTRLDVAELLGADTLGREVLPCPTFAAIPPARICAGASCDFNGDGHLDIRDLVLMARCVTGRGPCPDSAAARFDCNGDGSLGVPDVLCCARVILRGRLPDAVALRPAPAVRVGVGTPVASSAGVEVAVRVAGADLVGAARLAFAAPGGGFARADVELVGAPPGWIEVHEIEDGQLVLGLVAVAPAEQLGGQLDLVVRLGLASGETLASDVRLADAEFAGPDGVPLAVEAPIVGVPERTPGFALSAARPNPFSRDTRFVLTQAQAADADVAIFDLAGRRVKTLHDGWLAAGEHPFRWDGTGRDGRRVRDGVYFYRIASAGEVLTRRLVLLTTR